VNKALISAALKDGQATLVIRNGRIVNVHTREILPGGVAILGEHIFAVGDVDYTVGPETKVIDAERQFIVPGFIEGHIHPESSNLSVPRFAEIVLAHGTTSIFTDFHEIAIVGGIQGVNAVLDEAAKTFARFHWVVPSHVPFSPGLETSGGKFDATVILPALHRAEAVGLSEVVSDYVLDEHTDLMASVAGNNTLRKSLVGHGPVTKGRRWSAFASIGIANDHEAIDVEDVLLRARAGIHAHLRHNLICPTLPTLIQAITENKIDTRLLSLVTDDTNAIVLTREGHIDYLVREAMKLGVDFITAIQMATLNPATSFHMERQIGAVAPGRFADVLILSDDTAKFSVRKTIAKGALVAEDGRYLNPAKIEAHAPVFHNTFHLRAPVSGADLQVAAPPGKTAARVHVMKTLPWIPITEGAEAILKVVAGRVACDPSQDVIHIAVVERHHKTGNIGRAFLGGFGLKSGALASSMAHDNHNIAVAGVSPDDCAMAVNRVAELDGGIVFCDQGKIVAEIAFPQFGLLCDLDAHELAARKQALLDAMGERGCGLSEAHMFLGFLTLVPIPRFKITDKGYVDGETLRLIDPVLSWS
jgi:adenine deaminase